MRQLDAFRKRRDGTEPSDVDMYAEDEAREYTGVSFIQGGGGSLDDHNLYY